MVKKDADEHSPAISGSFTYKITTPVATVVNGQCQCYVASLTFTAPKSSSSSAVLGGVELQGVSGEGEKGGFNVTHGPLKFK